MTSRAPITFRHVVTGRRPRSTSQRSLQSFQPERYSDLVRGRGGPISVPSRLMSTAMTTENRLTKLLLNVNIESSLGPVQVIMAPEDSVRDLIKAEIEIYMKEKRIPVNSQTY